MTVPSSMECPIAQDLLVPYVADEIRPETKQWLNGHLSRCESCRSALAAMTDAAGAVAQVPAPPAPTDPGRKLVGRVRLTVWVIIAAVVGMLLLTGGSIYFGVRAITQLAGFDVEHPVPTTDVTPAQVLSKLDLSDLGLTAPPLNTRGDKTATLDLANPSGRPVIVQAIRMETPRDSRDSFRSIYDGYGSRFMSAETIVPSHAIAKFRGKHQYVYLWQEDRWVFYVSVDDQITDPVTLRDAIRDHLFQAIRQAGQ